MKKRYIFLYLIIAAIFSIILVITVNAVIEGPKTSFFATQGRINFVTENWTYTDDNTSFSTTLPLQNNVEPNQKYSLSRTLTTEDSGQAILIKSVKSSIFVTVDGENIYSYDKIYTYTKSPLTIWQIIDLPLDCANKTLSITILSPVNDGLDNVSQVLIGTHADCSNYVYNINTFTFILGVIFLSIGAIILMFFFTSKKRTFNSHSFLFFSISSILFGIFSIAYCARYGIFFKNTYLMDCLMYISAFLFSVTFTLYMFYELSPQLNMENKFDKTLKILMVILNALSFANMATQITLVLFKVTDFFTLRYITTIIYVLMFALLITIESRIYVINKNKISGFGFLACALLSLFVVGEMVLYFLMPNVYTGELIKAGILIYMLMSVGSALAKVFIQYDENYKLKEELAEMKSSLMISQIKPHFLYNALTAIKSLCVLDPKKAEESIMNFSTYLRSNIRSITDSQYIFFEQELNHIRSYLEIEQVRFGDKLSIVYDIKEKNFFVPPLTVEVLIENAVHHGIFKKSGKGTVSISSYADEINYYVIVKDDGVGFDLTILDNPQGSYGIRNIRFRLDKLCDAKLKFESEVGKGTTVTITFPKKSNEKNANSEGEIES